MATETSKSKITEANLNVKGEKFLKLLKVKYVKKNNKKSCGEGFNIELARKTYNLATLRSLYNHLRLYNN